MSKDFFAEYLTKISFLLNNRDNTLVVEKGKKTYRDIFNF